MNNISKLLKSIQKESKYNQKDIAQYLGISERSYQRFENDPEGDMKKLRKFATFFDVSYNLLLDELKIEDNDTNTNIKIKGNNNVSAVGQGHTTISGDININKLSVNPNIKEIVELLDFAPNEFLNTIKDRLEKFRDLTRL